MMTSVPSEDPAAAPERELEDAIAELLEGGAPTLGLIHLGVHDGIPVGVPLATQLLRFGPEGREFAAVWVVLAPRSDPEGVRARISGALAAGGAPNERAMNRLALKVPGDGDVATLLALLAEVPAHSAVILEHAELVHTIEGDFPPTRATAPAPLGKAMGMHFSADAWVPAVCALGEALRACPWASDVHVHVLVNRRMSSVPEHLDALARCFDGTFSLSRIDGLDEAEVGSRIAGWRGVLLDRGIAAVRTEIAGYTADPSVAAQLLAQCLYTSGRWEEAYRVLEPLLVELRAGPPAMLGLLANITLYSGRVADVQSLLLQLSAATQVEESVLREGHATAVLACDAVAQGALLDRLRSDYPHALYPLRIDLLQRFDDRDYAGVLELAAGLTADPELPRYRFMIDLSRNRCARGELRPDALLEQIRSHSPDRVEHARAELAEDAIAGRRYADALMLLQEYRPSDSQARRCAFAGCGLLRALAIESEVDTSIWTGALELVLQFVSDHAEDIDLRAELLRALSVEQAGAKGWTMLLDRLLTAPELPPSQPLRDPGDVVLTTHVAFLEYLGARYISTGPQNIHIRPELLQSGLSTGELRGLLAAGTAVMGYAGSRLTDDDGTNILLLVAKACLDLAQTIIVRGGPLDESAPIAIFHGVAQSLANAGLVQQACDHVNLTLTYAGAQTTPSMKRCGWVAHADINLRVHRVEEAMLGLLCARAQRVSESGCEERYLEIELHIRMLRTLRFYGPALARIPALRQAAADVGVASGKRKVDDLETGLRFMLLAERCEGTTLDAEQRGELQAIVAAACNSTAFAVERREEVIVPTVLLAQLLSMCDMFGVEMLAARQLFECALAELPQAQRDDLRSLASPTVDVAAMLRSARIASRTRRTVDLGASLERVRLDALRLLARPGRPEDALLAIELLADPSLAASVNDVSPEARGAEALQLQLQRGYHFFAHGPDALPGDMATMPAFVMTGQPDVASPTRNTILEPERLPKFACELGRDGCELRALAQLDDRLVNVGAFGGELLPPQYEEPPVFDAAALAVWQAGLLELFARASSTDPAGVIETQAAMAGLGYTADLVSPCIVVYLLTRALTRLPANLLLRNGELSGMKGPVAVVPSLSWLLEQRLRPSNATGRQAWILPAGPESGALGLLADNLPGLLPGFVVGATFPSLQQPLAVAILAAHGGIDESGLFFRSVADEQALRYSIAQVATALAGCDLVVLCVCSGGRSDPAPFSARTIGLPSALLAAGCRTVLASPWPLDALAVLRWIPLFFAAWDSDTDVAVAVHRANLALMRTYCHPRDFLAMHVFGEAALRPQAPIT
jgi:hypothetical protein